MIGACVSKPSKFIGIGLNFKDHAEEQNLPIPKEPIIFSKFTSCVTGPNDPIIVPKGSNHTDWEVELGFVIGKKAINVSVDEAMDHVLGFFLVNDVSERNFQKNKGLTWDKGKGFDTFGPIGPYIITKDELPDYQNLNMFLDVDGKRMQTGNTEQMIFDIKTLVSYMSSCMSLHPGSAIAFTKKGGLKDPTIVAYKGVAPIKTNLVKGDIDVGVLNLGEALTEINDGTLCVSVVLANNRMAKIGDSPTAKELGIPVSLSTVRGFVTKKGAPAERVKELEAGMMKAMGHNYYKNFLTEIGLDDTSVVGADEWGKQMEEMLTEMTAQLKALGYIK